MYIMCNDQILTFDYFCLYNTNSVIENTVLFMFMTIYTIFVAEVSQEIFVEGMNEYKPLPVLKNESISGHCIVLRMSESVADM